jgi:NTE family protein
MDLKDIRLASIGIAEAKGVHPMSKSGAPTEFRRPHVEDRGAEIAPAPLVGDGSRPRTIRSPAAGASTRSGRRTHRMVKRPPFECVALLLQGGGALGAYQAGVYEALAEADLHPDWVAGISIGAINSAIIAGNPPAERVAKLRSFWEAITANPLLDWAAAAEDFAPRGDLARGMFNQLSATWVSIAGAAEFFRLRQPFPWLQPDGALEATSIYETNILKPTLERLVDFDRINACAMRFSVGAVNVRTGNFVYFDTTRDMIRPEHVMASGALPPGFPAIEIEGEHYWDGGLISNTPLQWVVDRGPRQDTLAFQVDLWSARGEFPRNLVEVATRQKEIQYSSRTRANTDEFKRYQCVRSALAGLLSKLPPELRDGEDAKLLSSVADNKVYNIVHLIYRSKHYEGNSRDYEFSRLTMQEHWRAGYHDAVRTLRHPEVLQRPTNLEGFATFDLAFDGRE